MKQAGKSHGVQNSLSKAGMETSRPENPKNKDRDNITHRLWWSDCDTRSDKD